MMVVCNWFLVPSLTPKYYTMWVVDTDFRVIISSEPVPGIAPLEYWQPFKNKTLRIFDLKKRRIKTFLESVK